MTELHYKPKQPTITPKLAKQMIHCNEMWINILTERVESGYCVEITQKKINAHEEENARLRDYLETK